MATATRSFRTGTPPHPTYAPSSLIPAVRVPEYLFRRPDLVSMLLFDQRSNHGLTLVDETDLADSTIENTAAPWKTGALGRYVELRGATSYVQTKTRITAWKRGTIAALVRMDTQTDPSAFFISDFTTTLDAAGDGSIAIFADSAGSFKFAKHDGTAIPVFSSSIGVLADEKWHLVSVEWSDVTGVRMFANGRLEASFTTTTAKDTPRSAPVDLRINRELDAQYGDMDIAFFGAWQGPIGVGAHHDLHRSVRTPVA